jgi:TM2 domain-containing membrane protein YozV
MATRSGSATRRLHSVPEEKFEQSRFCARCGQPIVVARAQYCKACGAPVARFQLLRHDPGFNPTVAFVLSIIPGLGHFYRGKIFRGVLWFFFVGIAYSIGGFPGLIIHFICASNAAFSGAIREDALVGPSAR